MILNRTGAEFEYEGVTYTIGGAIVGTAESEYAGLYGRINAIHDGEDKETENETPDIYCEFDPPVMPHEVKALEDTFSDLYHQPKTIADIVLDMVIMAPEMIRPLDDLRSMRKRVNVFLVMEDWAVNGEHGNDCEAFSDYDDAKRVMTNRIREELEDGSVPSWRESSIFAENSSMDFYEAYLDGEYMENHYKIMIIRQPLMMSSMYIREVGGVYKAQCQTEDFISQIEQWDEVAALSDAQYQRLITNPMIPECIERHLGRNDHYWEAYWESVSEAAHGLVRQASKQPDCFTPEAENPYPLCIGSGKSECDDCCLYMHMKGEGGYICSPLSGSTAEEELSNIWRARAYMLYARTMLGYLTRAPHAYLPMLLCDHVAAERALALQFGLQLLEQSEVLLICGDRISRGMKGEIHHAAQLGIPIIVYCEDLYLDVRKLATRAGADKKLVAMDETHPALASNAPGTDRSWEVRCLA